MKLCSLGTTMEPAHCHIHLAFTQVENPGCKDLECERHEWKFWVKVGWGMGGGLHSQAL